MKKELRIISPTGHLGFAPMKLESFKIGLKENPDYICADSGSDDIGPTPLGKDSQASPVKWQEHDLENILLACRELKIPMIIGSACDTGTNRGVDLYVSIIERLARKHGLSKFRLAYIYSQQSKEFILDRLKKGIEIKGLDGRPPLTEEDVKKTDNIVAVMGVHPIIEALNEGADVIICGRSSDVAIFAAPAIKEGFPKALSYYLGKVLECASFCAEPYMGKESVLGIITHEDVKVKALHPNARCTIASVAGHAMYERANPFYEYFVGGRLNMRNCRYEQYDEKTTRITGPVFEPAERYFVKLEGAGKVGERYFGIAGIRDPYTIKNLDKVIEWAKNEVRSEFGKEGYQLHFHVFGKNGVMEELEPIKHITPHEVGIVVEGVAPTEEMAESITITATRQIFYARLPEVKGTAGGCAYIIDEVLKGTPAYMWTMNHAMQVDDPMELFKVNMIEIG
ncbi:hypothetical protein H0A61_01071 [Koleobacter methoxysyntrophicus]|uniref:Acyclic terpene utilisation N-terminal domain-containing protein n=1 Tax=Koleobacter methoxysyntrophicus TaxID=2751313 RepID=A0A8A0RMA0_9FIRM|nr:acyclic terpene utilization AtuA family protein [Koleobacter methoxysyntrophicus]QSQ08728.1 hypothetical protein H0A61_01071 [Koleobacter methoxysyntrophicus]